MSRLNVQKRPHNGTKVEPAASHQDNALFERHAPTPMYSVAATKLAALTTMAGVQSNLTTKIYYTSHYRNYIAIPSAENYIVIPSIVHCIMIPSMEDYFMICLPAVSMLLNV